MYQIFTWEKKRKTNNLSRNYGTVRNVNSSVYSRDPLYMIMYIYQ